jgi:hypothetical protein
MMSSVMLAPQRNQPASRESKTAPLLFGFA